MMSESAAVGSTPGGDGGKTRSDHSGTFGNMPTIFLPRAPMIPAQCVPWPKSSPEVGMPLPKLVLKATFNSGWVGSIPVSITATALMIGVVWLPGCGVCGRFPPL